MADWGRSEVHQLVKQTNITWAHRLASIQSIDGRIRDWRARLHPSLTINLADAPSDTLPNLLLLHIVHHLSLCVLHSSVVPLFSWSTNDGAPQYAQQLSAQVAFDNANAIASHFEAAQNAGCSPSRMAGLAGYAAYCACAVQIPFLWSTMLDMKQRMRKNLSTNLGVLRGIGEHWKFIELLVSFHSRLMFSSSDLRRGEMCGEFLNYMQECLCIRTESLFRWIQHY
jgi:hypothetical protein